MKNKNKIIKTAIAILLFVLLISMVGIAFSLFYDIKVVRENRVFLGESKIYISNEARDKIMELYPNDLKVEIPTCLLGEITTTGVYVYDLYETKIIENNESYVKHISCPPASGKYKTIGSFHNHPSGTCYFSGTDLETYSYNLQNSEYIIGIVCGKEEYKFSLLADLEVVN